MLHYQAPVASTYRRATPVMARAGAPSITNLISLTKIVDGVPAHAVTECNRHGPCPRPSA